MVELIILSVLIAILDLATIILIKLIFNCMAKVNELVIQIFESCNEPGYFYDIFDSLEPEAESLDGGICTSTIENALDMAVEQAKQIIKHSK
jgi:hypothetical protein